MKQQAMTKLIALAASVAIAGCVAPGPLGTADLSRPAATSAVAQKAGGTVELSVLWPDLRRGYGTQAIPNRATKVVVSLENADGTAVKDLSGQDIAPVEATRASSTSYINTYGKFRWELPQQSNLRLHADLYGENGVIATADRVVDVIAGFRSVVAMDLILPNAPMLSSISSPSFRVGETIVLKGTHFGKSDQWPARVFLQSESNHDESPFDDGPRHHAAPIYLPDSHVTVVSDTEIRVTVPEMIREEYRTGFLTEFLWNYFNGDDPRLTIGVTVDGVNSPRLDVSMPKEVGLKANVTLEEGTDAPAHRLADQRFKAIDLTDATFSVPVATGTEWVFEMTGNEYFYNRQKTVIRLLDSQGQASIKSEYEYGSPYERMTNLNHDWEYGFVRRIDAIGISLLPDEPVTLPDGKPATAKHLAYSYSNGALNDLWIVPNVGPVRMRQLNVNSYNGELWRSVRDFRLTGFKPATASTGN